MWGRNAFSCCVVLITHKVQPLSRAPIHWPHIMTGNQVLYSATMPLEGAATRAKFEKGKEERGLVPYFIRLVTAFSV